MGYDIHGWKTMWKEEIGYVGCHYAWQHNFKKYLGFDIKELNGIADGRVRYFSVS